MVIGALVGIIAILVGALIVVALRSSKEEAPPTPAPQVQAPGFGTITAFVPASAAWSVTDAVTAPDGSVYFSARGSVNSVGKIGSGGQVSLLKVPGTDMGTVVVASDGTIWTSTVVDNATAIVRMANDGSNVRLFQVPAVDLGAMGKRTVFPIHAMLLAPDGSLWFQRGQINRWDSVGGYSSAIGHLGTTGKMDVFAISDRLYAPGGMVFGPDGNLWFSATCVCARNGFIEVLPTSPTIDPKTGKAALAAKYTVPTKASGATGIGPHPSRMTVVGGNLWFVEQQDDYATEMTPAADISGNGAVGYIPFANASDKAIVEYPLPASHSRPTGIALGADGNLWVAESGIGKLARMSTDGRLLGEYRVTGAPDDVVAGPESTVYVTDGGAVDWAIQAHTDALTGNQFPSFSPYPTRIESFRTKS